jgi:hypothetical protein
MEPASGVTATTFSYRKNSDNSTFASLAVDSTIANQVDKFVILALVGDANNQASYPVKIAMYPEQSAAMATVATMSLGLSALLMAAVAFMTL